MFQFALKVAKLRDQSCRRRVSRTVQIRQINGDGLYTLTS